MPNDDDDSMQKIMQIAGQFLPAIVLNSEAKVWSDLVLSFVRLGVDVDEAIAKADHVMREHRSRFGSTKTMEALFENAPKADLRAIR